MKNIRRMNIVVALIITLSTSVAAQDLKKGKDAYKAGDYATAFQEFLPLAEKGNSDAQFHLGIMFEYGLGVPLDHTEAMKWFRPVAEIGNSIAQNSLANLYINGKGVSTDYTEAFKWNLLAAEQGYGPAQNALGLMYYYGLGVPQGVFMSHMWHNIANANGVDGAYMLGIEREALMSDDSIKKSQALAKECINSNYKNCGSSNQQNNITDDGLLFKKIGSCNQRFVQQFLKYKDLYLGTIDGVWGRNTHNALINAGKRGDLKGRSVFEIITHLYNNSSCSK